MFLTANPEKCRRAEELEELKKLYCRGDKVLPKIQTREREQIRDRQVEDSDRSLVDEVREMSLQEALLEDSDRRIETHPREDEGLSAAAPTRSTDITLESRRVDGHPRARRRRREGHQPRDSGERSFQLYEVPHRRRHHRSHQERSSELEDSNLTSAHQINQHTPLHSVVTPIDTDSQDMEDEILRQIREEGLLDGIDLENIDVSQEDQISEWIAEAFRRRQNERARHELNGQNRVFQTGQRNRSRSESAHISRDETSRDSLTIHESDNISLSNGSSQASQQNRPRQSPSALQTTRLRATSQDDTRPRNQHTNDDNSSTAGLISRTRTKVRPGTRSATNLRDRSQSAISPENWSVPQLSRSTIDLTSTQSMEKIIPPVLSQSTMHPSWSSQFSPFSRTDSSFATAEANDNGTTNTNTPNSSPNSTSSSIEPVSSQTQISEEVNIHSSELMTPSPCSVTRRIRSSFFTEPLINCFRCGRNHIEYEWHYNCRICSEGHYNICLSCYRSGRGCLHWLGFGLSAWKKWEIMNQSRDNHIEKPHILTPSRYLPPKTIPGGADGRRTLTTDDPRNRLQSGTFCASCYAWTNQCYWRCDVCNDGDWGFCNTCVNQGRCCTHPLLPLSYRPADDDYSQIPPTHGHERPINAHILTGPGVIDMGAYKPLTFYMRCDICCCSIQPSQFRYHCFSCTGKSPNSLPGSYDVCTRCYSKLVRSRLISVKNGPRGWRRCLKGHRMAVVGFQMKYGGQHRLVIHDAVGGNCLQQKAYTSTDRGDLDLQLWSWGDGRHARGDNSNVKLVTTDVKKSAPSTINFLALERAFPPDGGVGMRAMAIWGWFPSSEADDELLFPRGAEIRECKNINGDWFYGSYMGRKGLFPAKYVVLINTGPVI